jgi:hypothetical protein
MRHTVQIGKISDLPLFTKTQKLDLKATRGDSFQAELRMYREVDGCGYGVSAQTLAGLTGRAMVRPSVDHPLSWELTVTVDETAGSGRVTLAATDEETRMMPETGVWELELYDGAGLRKTIVAGKWKLSRDSVM